MKNVVSYPIDFVLPWVDGSDPKWQAKREETLQKAGKILDSGDDGNSACRYRDMDTLRYWFRSVEECAPWVNKVFFVTCGQTPDWLNVNHPKLVLINHEDYMPSDYLPTFNSRPIELNLHRISELSEHFVLFNDDVFLLNPVRPDIFFFNGSPVLPCNMNICRFYGNNTWSKVCFNDFCTVNDHFDLKDSIWSNRDKWFSIRSLGFKIALMNYIRFKINKSFSINGYEHLAHPHLKSTFEEVWSVCPDVLDFSSRSQFRSVLQVNHWLMIAWNMAKGSFSPIRPGERGTLMQVSSETIEKIVNTIKNRSVTQISMNDSYRNDNPEMNFKIIAQALDTIFPKKSSFEA